MSYAQRQTVTVTTDGSGDSTDYTTLIQYGRIHSITYTKTDFAVDVDFAITIEGTGEGVWTESDVNATKTVAPRMATHDVAGNASLYDTVSSEPVEGHIVIVDDRVKIVVSNGGDTKTGTFNVVFD